MNRLEKLRKKIDLLIMEHQPSNARHFTSHLYGVSEYCALLALRRGHDPELAQTAGMLHDIYQVTHNTIEKHAIKGAVVAGEILESMDSYSSCEIEKITHAISRHSKKRKVHEPFDEVLKDADVMSHFLYNTDFPIVEKEVERVDDILAELGCKKRTTHKGV